MAEEDGSTNEVTPERRLAARVLQERGLSPPVPVEELVAERMEIEEEYFPGDCDAVVFGLTDSDRRPRLILNRSRPLARRRFTLAHEYGHLQISWHLGTIICHTDLREQEELAPEEDEPLDELGDEIHRITEREANSFASELLMPHTWLRGLVASESVPKAIEAVQIADVSAAAACFAMSEVLPPGNLLAVLDNESRARYLFRTSQTDVPLRYRGQLVDPPSLDAVAADHAQVRYGNQVVYWWHFEQHTSLVQSDDVRTASELLDEMLDELVPLNARARLRSRINGIVGSAKNRTTDHTPEGLHAELRLRFANRSDLGGLERHADFPLFLSRKADEIAETK